MSGGSKKSGEGPDSTRLSPAVSSSDKTPPKSGSRPPSTIITPPTAPVATAGPVQKPKKVTDDKSTKLLKKPTNVNKKLSPRKVKEDLIRKQIIQNPNSKLADLRSQRELEAANKKLEGLTADVTKLKKELSTVTKENTAVKNERSIKDLEIEKLGQFWQISKNELKDAIKQRYEVEERYERMKTAHMEEVSKAYTPQTGCRVRVNRLRDASNHQCLG
uniref:RAB6-interacting golgin n=1 Tax=Panagrellus redivivus TaxID=6233 RepID=A0A7E4UQ46_PANRE